MGYIFRFVNNLKCRLRKNKESIVTDEILSIQEYECALTKLIIADQRIIKQCSNFEKLKNSLKLFEDNGILRLRGRFSNANLTYQSKFPVLLRSGSYLTDLIIRNSHEKTLHHGVESTLAFLRENYWITQGRKTIQNILGRSYC